MSIVFYVNENLVLKYEQEGETLGMGGPFTGDLYLNGRKLKGKYVVGEPKFSVNGKYLLVTKYNVEGRGREDIHFTLVVLDFSTGLAYESHLKFKLLTIESITDKRIICYESTHNQFEDKKRMVEFSLETFSALDIWEN